MKKILILAVLLTFLPSLVFGQEIAYFGIENDINGDIVKTKLDITFSNAGENRFVFPVYASISDFNFTSNFGADCFLEKKTYGSDVVCTLFGLSDDKRSLVVNFTTFGLPIKSDNQFLFRNDISMPLTVKKFFYQIVLPPGTGLVQDKSLITPEGWEATTDGRRIFLFWNREDLSNGQTFSINVVYEPVSIISGFLIGPQAQILVSGGLIGSVLLAFLFWKRRSMIQVVLPVLKDDEKRIFESIMKRGSGVHQRMIVGDSNYSKAKVSKVLKSLEQRGLVKLERVGRSNKVHMVENFAKKPLKEPGNN